LSKSKKTIQRVRESFNKWRQTLGLNQWTINIHHYYDPEKVVDVFGTEGNIIVVAKTNVEWTYGIAEIQVNILALNDKTDEEIDRIVVHELMHVLVNEMREGELHHEERVVTQLTNAIFWTLDNMLAKSEETEQQEGSEDG
jgi:hypothetical protein